MPNSESKTTEDILREMREYADQLDNGGDITGADFRDFANQIEQAIARDTLCLSDGSLVVVRSAEIRARLAQLDAEYIGYKNMAALYYALIEVKKKLSGWWEWTEVENVVEEALAKPLRNCDLYDTENGAAECMQAIDAAWHEIDTIRATIGWMLAPVDTKGADDGI